MAILTQLQLLRRDFPEWSIDIDYSGWTATHTDFDASYEGEEDGWVGNGLSVNTNSLQALRAEIEAIIEEHPHFNQGAF